MLLKDLVFASGPFSLYASDPGWHEAKILTRQAFLPSSNRFRESFAGIVRLFDEDGCYCHRIKREQLTDPFCGKLSSLDHAGDFRSRQPRQLADILQRPERLTIQGS